MKTTTVAALAALAAMAAAPALAQAPASPPAQAPAASAPASTPAAASGAALSVKTTPISTLVKEPRAKAALEKELPEISQYYDQIGSMTLAEVVPMAGGAITDQNLQRIQAELDKIK